MSRTCKNQWTWLWHGMGDNQPLFRIGIATAASLSAGAITFFVTQHFKVNQNESLYSSGLVVAGGLMLCTVIESIRSSFAHNRYARAHATRTSGIDQKPQFDSSSNITASARVQHFLDSLDPKKQREEGMRLATYLCSQLRKTSNLLTQQTLEEKNGSEKNESLFRKDASPDVLESQEDSLRTSLLDNKSQLATKYADLINAFTTLNTDGNYDKQKKDELPPEIQADIEKKQNSSLGLGL